MGDLSEDGSESENALTEMGENESFTAQTPAVVARTLEVDEQEDEDAEDMYEPHVGPLVVSLSPSNPLNIGYGTEVALLLKRQGTDVMKKKPRFKIMGKYVELASREPGFNKSFDDVKSRLEFGDLPDAGAWAYFT